MKKILKKAGLFALFIVILGLVSLGANYGIYCEIQKRLKIQMTGKYVPAVFLPSFEVRQGSFAWEDKVQLLAGDLKVTFDPLSIFSQQGLRVVITSNRSKIRLLGSWALQEGIKDAMVDSMVADIILGRRGLAGINAIEVRSPSFQFFFKNADKKQRNQPEVL